jgi:glucokinase
VSAFHALAESAGDALASAATLIDGLVVIGGGLSGAAPVFLPRLVAEMNDRFETGAGPIPRLAQRVFNLEDPAELAAFCRGDVHEVTVPGSGRKIAYDPLQRIGVGLSRLGTSRATSIGAYAFALSALDQMA